MMRAVVLRAGELLVKDIPEPELGPGQLLVEPIATGICGGDLSVRQHTADFLREKAAIGATGSVFDPDKDLVLGHEFTSRVLEVGPRAIGYAPGDNIVTLPHVVDREGVRRTVGHSNDYPGGLAERVVVQAEGHLLIPDGVPADLAAVTEPMATGLNGVLRSHIEVPAGAIVTGCGPVGLGSVVELRQRGIYPVVASDPSPLRRQVALELGADKAVDPAETDPVSIWMDLADRKQQLYVFEASGSRGILNTLMYTVPPFSRIFVVGANMLDESIRTLVGVSKNVAIEFVGGPGPGDSKYHALAAMLRHIARGSFDPRSVVTGCTGYEGVPQLFDLLRRDDPHGIDQIKVLVRHDLDSAAIHSYDEARRLTGVCIEPSDGI